MGGQPQNLTDTIAMINYQRAIPRAPNISGLLSPNHWQSSPRLPFQMGQHEFGRRDPILWQPQNRENNWKCGNHGENRPPIDLALGRCVVRRSSPPWLKSPELYGVNDGNFVHIIAHHSCFTWACLKTKATSFHPLVKHHCPQWPTLTRSNAPKFNRLLIYMPVSQTP